MNKVSHIKQLALAVVFSLTGSIALGQTVGPSDPSPAQECGEYTWPTEPCPEVQVKQKHDHTPLSRYRRNGWDTVVTCAHRSIELSCAPFIPVQKFNGQYYVDQIAYNPPDPTFALGTRMPISTDDNFSNYSTNIPYPFYFFGIRKTSFVLGANGLVAFGPVPVTNNDDEMGPSCPWSFSAGIPWTDNTSGAPGNLSYMRDAIYGVYEDTYPRESAHTTGAANWGIYYGIQDEYPCRKIICSWNDVPQFSCNSLHCTYQIVCYEGSNIIEVHVKERNVCTSWQGGVGIIGIQNATGNAQQASSDPMAPNSSQLINGRPAAFFPSGRNPFTSSISQVAYRFTPNGTTLKEYKWYRIFDDGRPDYELPNASTNPSAVNDPNGYYYPMNDQTGCPTLTRAIVSPKEPSKYVMHLRFKNANNDWYRLYDTVFVGVDTLNYLNIHKQVVDDKRPSNLVICIGDTAKLRVDMGKLQEVKLQSWNFYRISGGDTILLTSLEGNASDDINNTFFNLGNYQQLPAFRLINNDTIPVDTNLYVKEDYAKVGDSVLVRPIQVFSNLLPTQGLQANKVDSILIQVSYDFISGCTNYDTMLVRIYPDFDTTVLGGICDGESYTWDANGQSYDTPTDPANTWVKLQSEPGCDSIVRLKLKVDSVQLTPIYVSDCKPYTWLDSNGVGNGKTYYQTNSSTRATDTWTLKNQYGCDSVLQLVFTLHPLTAKLRSDVDHFDLDHLDAVLTDISIGNDSRVWKLPKASDQTGVNAYYSIPAELDGANITLIAKSPYGCEDSAKIYLPLNKEHFWMPNAFTPDNPAGNQTFGSISTKTLQQEMLIYNRRGELVFRCEGVDCTWDGRDLNGNACIQGAYVYIIRYTNEFEPNVTRTLQGTVMLIR